LIFTDLTVNFYIQQEQFDFRSGSRASSETPEVKSGRRTSDSGVRLGGGLVETGRPQVKINHRISPLYVNVLCVVKEIIFLSN
jgi:hypothetical protein